MDMETRKQKRKKEDKVEKQDRQECELSIQGKEVKK